MNGSLVFLEKGFLLHLRIRGNNLVTRNGFPEGSCNVPNKGAYMDYETCTKVVKVVSSGIRKINVRNVDLFCQFYSLYI